MGIKCTLVPTPNPIQLLDEFTPVDGQFVEVETDDEEVPAVTSIGAVLRQLQLGKVGKFFLVQCDQFPSPVGKAAPVCASWWIPIADWMSLMLYLNPRRQHLIKPFAVRCVAATMHPG